MPGFRFVDPAPVIFDLLGLASAPDGSLTFYEKGTTTPKNTWSDQALTTPAGLNPNPIDLDSSGRAEVEIWLDGEYTVVAKAFDGSTIWTRDVVPEIAPGLAIPDLTGVSGYFLSNDGTNPIWVPITLLPDPSGSAGYQVVVNSDGTGYILQPIAEVVIPEPEIVVTASSLRAGVSDDPTKGQWYFGTGSAPASGTKQTTAAIVYPVSFSTTPYPFVQVTGGPFTDGNSAGGYFVDDSLTSMSNSGFTVTFNANHGEDNADGNIINAVTFNWGVYGTVEVP